MNLCHQRDPCSTNVNTERGKQGKLFKQNLTAPRVFFGSYSSKAFMGETVKTADLSTPCNLEA